MALLVFHWRLGPGWLSLLAGLLGDWDGIRGGAICMISSCRCRARFDKANEKNFYCVRLS